MWPSQNNEQLVWQLDDSTSHLLFQIRLKVYYKNKNKNTVYFIFFKGFRKNHTIQINNLTFKGKSSPTELQED